jgi:predicted alpha/beta superfamily hydrolase
MAKISGRTPPLRTAVLFLSLLILALPAASNRAAAVQAQETKPFIIGEIVTIESKILGEDRELFIYTHPAYNEDVSRYPVAYVLDGEWNFRYTSGVIDLLSSREIIPWMIVVGIPNLDRMKDLSPSRLKDQPQSGSAAAFRRFLRDEVFPYVEGHYRTEPFRLLVGHSLAGLFTVDTLFSEPGFFNAYLAVSPYLIWDDNKYLDSVVRKQVALPDRRTFLSVSLGGEPKLRPAFERLEKTLAERNEPRLEHYFRRLDDCDHEMAYLQGVVRGLLDIFHEWRLPPAAAAAGLDGIRKHYDGLTVRHGYEIRPVYFVVNMIGSDFMGRGESDEAIRILQYAISLNPGLPHAYENLGWCFSQKGMVEEAIRHYEKALELSPGEANIRKALEEIKKRKLENDPVKVWARIKRRS